MINKMPKISFIYDRYKKASLNRKASIEMRITYNYKQKYISTGIMLYPNQWKKGKVVNTPDIFQISEVLDTMLKKVRQIICDMMEEGNIDIYDISNRLKKIDTDKINFLEFCKQRATIRKYGKEKDTQERYNRFIKLFEAWGQIIDFNDINETNLIGYDKYLDSTGMKTYSKWNNYHRFLNSFIIDAIDAGYIRKNPYRWVNIERGKSNKGISKYLTLNEFSRLKISKMPTLCIERIRDTFVFQTYTCLSYADLKDFDSTKVQDIKGMKVYVGNRQKTKRTFTIPLLPPALEILDKYNGKLPIISNVKYNEYLKIVAQASGIEKPISSHWARHTGATLLLNEGISMQIVSKICGHSSTKITEQVYAKLLDETVVDAIQDLDI